MTSERATASRTRALAGWGVWATTVLLFAAVSVHVVVAAPGARDLLPFVVGYTGCSTVGALIVARRPRLFLGWVLLVAGLLPAVQLAARFTTRFVLDTEAGWVGTTALAWLASWLWMPSLVLLLVFVPLLFPDGRLVSHRWRWLRWMGIALLAASAGLALTPGPLHLMDGRPLPLQNPLGLRALAGPLDLLSEVFFPTLLATSLAAVASLLVRYRVGTPEQRHQIQWIVLAFAVTVSWLVVDEVVLDALWTSAGAGRDALSAAVTAVVAVSVPAAMGVAVLRHRLFDVEVVLNRTVVYGLLAAFVTGVYLVLVVGAGRMAGRVGGADPRLALLATGVAAVTFQPLRERVQHRVNRLMYGHRDDAYAALRFVTDHVVREEQSDSRRPSLAEPLARALRLAGVEIAVARDDAYERLDSWGTVTDSALEVALPYRGRVVGRLRAEGGRLRPLAERERRLLGDLATQLGVAVQAVVSADELQHVRERLVVAREDERRRLRRDLHDGLGSTLTGMILKLQTVREVLVEDGRARAVVDGVIADGRAALDDIRRLVYGLRPPALDDLGLLGALRAEADGSGRPKIQLDLPATLPPVSAALEVAVYRIVSEALTNVARHARAERCVVRLVVNGNVEVEISDDGQGLPPDARVGVGLLSMHERAAELGGSVEVGRSALGGTSVRVQLPREAP